MPVVNIKSNSEEKIVFDEVYSGTANSFKKIGSAADLLPKIDTSAGENSKYAIFMGGAVVGSSAYDSTVDECYNEHLVKQYLLNGVGLRDASAKGFNDNVIVGGSNNNLPYVYRYDTSLTKSSLTDLSLGRKDTGIACNDNYIIFAGGRAGSYSNAVDAYNTSYTRTTSTVGYTGGARRGADKVNNGKYAVFRGAAVLNAFSKSLALTATANQSFSASTYDSGTSFNGYALFYGANNGTAVEVFNSSLTRLNNNVSLSVAGRSINGDVNLNNNFLLIGGGRYRTGIIDVFDSSLTRISTGLQLFSDLSVVDAGKPAAKISDRYAIFGSQSYYGKGDIIYTYPGYFLFMTIPPFSKFKFGSDSNERSTGMESETVEYTDSQSPISGYIKPNSNNYFSGVQLDIPKHFNN